jgi:predicted RNase H-like HicB family nuclease
VTLSIELDREVDGRWIADVPELPGVMAYGATREETIAKVKSLALRVVAEEIENGEMDAASVNIDFAVAA